MKTFTTFLGSAVFAMVSCMQIVSAGELRPLVMPGAQQGYIQQQRPVEPSGTSLYNNFQADVSKMNPGQKDAAREHYSRLLKEAMDANDYTRIQHFSRLLEILK